MGRRHGDQALDAGERHRAALGRAHQAAADPVLAVVLGRRREDAVGPEALHGHGHAAWGRRRGGVKRGRSQQRTVMMSPGRESHFWIVRLSGSNIQRL